MTINNRERTMQVTLHSGQSYDVLSPVGFERTPPPKPTFWAATAEEAVRNGFAKFLANYGPLVRCRRYMDIDFGWGDAGRVYERIGAIRCETDRLKATWTVAIYYGHELVDAVRFVVPISASDEAADLAVEALRV
jgi:hypothetical protein